MKIHFVCTGNTFRSRMAEAYLKSRKITGLEVSSSGIGAHKNLNGPVSQYTLRTLGKHGLTGYLSEGWVATTKEEAESQDLLIFMERKHYEFCLNKLGCILPPYEIWDIPDVPNEWLADRVEFDEKIMAFAEDDFKKIKEKIDSRWA